MKGDPMEKRFTRGNLMSIISTVVSTVIMVSSVTYIYTQTSERANHNARDIGTLQTRALRVETSVQALEVSNARTDAQFNALSQSMDEVKSELRAIGSLLRSRQER